MVGEDVRPEVVSQLEDALEVEEADEKDFHVRQALQLLEVDGEGTDESEETGEMRRDDAEKTGEGKEKDEAESAEGEKERDHEESAEGES